jgi:DNA-binding beta-propeller fold protein YncE
MKKIPLLITACVISLLFFSPGSFVYSADGNIQKTEDKSWVWPLPPEKPRVSHLKTIVTPKDLGAAKGFFARIWAFIAGDDSIDRILSPHGVVADGEGNAYVADWGAGCVHYFNFQKKKYDQFNKTKDGNLVSPIGVALDDDGLLYVTDSVLRRVFVFSGSRNKRIIGDDGLLRPTGIAVNKKDKLLYVVDTLGNRVEVFDLSGKKLRSFGKQGGGNGEFNYPTDLAVDAKGDLYVMDTLNFRVQIFDKDGTFISMFGGNGTAVGSFMKPKGIAVDSEGHIWVSDGFRNTVQVFSRDGRLLLIFGKLGAGNGEFNIPSGVYIDSRDRLYVADSYNYRVQVFQYLKQ